MREAADGLAASEEDLVLLAMFGKEAEALLQMIRQRHSRESLLLGGEDVEVERAERIRELVKIVQESGVGEIEIEDEGMRVSVRRADEARLAGRHPAIAASRRRPRSTRPAPPPVAADGSCGSSRRWSASSTGAGAGLAGVRRGRRRRHRRSDALPARGDEALQRAEGRDATVASARSTSRTGRPVEFGTLLFELEPIRATPGASRTHVFSRVLVANRGEIAVRVIRALHELGIEAVAVYSTADADALHVALADQAVCIGPPAAAESYLQIPSVIAAAETTRLRGGASRATASSPRTRASLRACADNDLVFIGPSPEVMERWVTRPRRRSRCARPACRSCRAPRPPRRSTSCAQTAEEIGFPVLLKATAGGGGKGMRLVSSEDELEASYRAAAAEAEAAFGDGSLYLEKAV